MVGRPIKQDPPILKLQTKRLRDREHKRRVRIRYAQEVATLKQAIANMTRRMERMRTRRIQPLSWHEVAVAMKEDMAYILQNNHILCDELHRFSTLTDAVMRHLQQNHSIPWSLALKPSIWRDAHLFDGPELRQSGYEWITNTMFLTLPHELKHAEFSLDKNTYSSVVLDDDTVRMCIMHEMVVDADFAEASSMAKRHPLEVQNFRHKITNATTILDTASNGDIIYIRNTGVPGFTVNIVTRQYMDENTSLVVSRSIVEDEKYPYHPSDYRSDIREWTLVTRLGEKCSRIRQYMSFTQPFLGREKMSLAEFAPIFLREGTVSDFYDRDEKRVIEMVHNALIERHDHSQRRFEEFFTLLRQTAVPAKIEVHNI